MRGSHESVQPTHNVTHSIRYQERGGRPPTDENFQTSQFVRCYNTNCVHTCTCTQMHEVTQDAAGARGAPSASSNQSEAAPSSSAPSKPKSSGKGSKDVVLEVKKIPPPPGRTGGAVRHAVGPFLFAFMYLARVRVWLLLQWLRHWRGREDEGRRYACWVSPVLRAPRRNWARTSAVFFCVRWTV